MIEMEDLANMRSVCGTGSTSLSFFNDENTVGKAANTMAGSSADLIGGVLPA